MGIEDTYSGATAAMTFFNAYIYTVAEEIGIDRAMSLFNKMSETMGTMQGKMMKEQAGFVEIDTKAAWSAVKTYPESLGIKTEVVEESPQEVVVRLGKCPIYSAAQRMGLDARTIETMCINFSARLMDAVIKQFDPNLSYQLRKFRLEADDFCKEAIVKS